MRQHLPGQGDALYTLDGDLVLPGPLTLGPWAPGIQHGGPVAALLARAVEAVPTPVPMQVARLTVELLHPVPVAPLRLQALPIRLGRRVGVVEVDLTADDAVVATARALLVRVAPVDLPAAERWPSTPSDPLAAAPRRRRWGEPPAFHLAAMEMRFVEGSWEGGGPAVVWERLRVPVVAGEEPSPLQRAVAAADSGNGISRVVPFDDYVFVNPDLTVALSRAPVGEWVGLSVRTRLNGDGWGQAESLLFDTEGPCGRAVQTLFVQGR